MSNLVPVPQRGSAKRKAAIILGKARLEWATAFNAALNEIREAADHLRAGLTLQNRSASVDMLLVAATAALEKLRATRVGEGVTTEVVVNGAKATVSGADLSHAQVVDLAFETELLEEAVAKTATVNYHSGPASHHIGLLKAGQVVPIRDGMVFNVALPKTGA